MTLREQFEKETGISEIEPRDLAMSVAYREWLESKILSLSTVSTPMTNEKATGKTDEEILSKHSGFPVHMLNDNDQPWIQISKVFSAMSEARLSERQSMLNAGETWPEFFSRKWKESNYDPDEEKYSAVLDPEKIRWVHEYISTIRNAEKTVIPESLKECRLSPERKFGLSTNQRFSSNVNFVADSVEQEMLEKFALFLGKAGEGLPTLQEYITWWQIESDEGGFISNKEIYDYFIPRASAALAAKEEQVKKLQAFKDYVHERLDKAGIATHPDGEHSAHGCRIGDRLDIVLKSEEQHRKDMKEFSEWCASKGWLYLEGGNWAKHKIAKTKEYKTTTQLLDLWQQNKNREGE